MQQLSILLIALFTSISLTAQVGEIQGKVKDMEMNGEGLPFANVYVEADGIPRSTSTDLDGFYSIKPLAPGTYKVTIKYLGYTTLICNNIIVKADQTTSVDFEMQVSICSLPQHISYIIPLINNNVPKKYSFTNSDLDKLPSVKIEDNIKLTPGVFGEF